MWGESTNSPLVQTQVFALLNELDGGDVEINILSLQPAHLWLAKNKSGFSILAEGIRYIRVPFPVFPQWRRFIYTKWFSRISDTWGSIVLCVYLLLFKTDVVHVRGYGAISPAIALKSLFGHRVIFDTRSDFIHELHLMGKCKGEIKFWTNKQNKFFEKSDIVVFTTEHFQTSVKLDRVNSIVIPNNITITWDYDDFEKNRRITRKKLGIASDALLLVYSGSLNNQWNKVDVYVEIVKELLEIDSKIEMLFLTKDVNLLNSVLLESGLSLSRIYVHSCEPSRVHEYLQAADMGLNFISNLDTRLSVKTVEYFASGLSILTNGNLLALNKIIEENQFGLLWDGDGKKLMQYLVETGDNRRLCYSYAVEKFDTKIVSREYKNLYLTT
jgi:glycosyltransferase involved in cell wall biosynthesis